MALFAGLRFTFSKNPLKQYLWFFLLPVQKKNHGQAIWKPSMFHCNTHLISGRATTRMICNLSWHYLCNASQRNKKSINQRPFHGKRNGRVWPQSQVSPISSINTSCITNSHHHHYRLQNKLMNIKSKHRKNWECFRVTNHQCHDSSF